jgi:hypothetical protein
VLVENIIQAKERHGDATGRHRSLSKSASCPLHRIGSTQETPGGPKSESGASWTLGSGEDQERIGVTVPAMDSDAAASIAVIAQEHMP